nr:MAG TPA: hypothetical protein [Caudoviricetes sp.]
MVRPKPITCTNTRCTDPSHRWVCDRLLGYLDAGLHSKAEP